MDPHRWRLDGQLALVTGGSAGIGLAIARELLGFGARVLITARNGDSLERARDEMAAEFPDGDIGALIADVADDEQRRELQIGRDHLRTPVTTAPPVCRHPPDTKKK